MHGARIGGIGVGLALLAALPGTGCLTCEAGHEEATEEPASDRVEADSGVAADAAPPVPAWRTLFDGKDLTGWEVTPFGGEGEVWVDEEGAVLDFGNSLTGLTWTGELPVLPYELEFEAARLAGTDFFSALTFPVGDASCSLVLGGWGGALVGLSSLDGQDAARNETTTYRDFVKGKRYLVRLEVSDRRIRAWLDGEPLVDASIAGREVSIRPEVELSKPLGVATFATRGGLYSMRWRPLPRTGDDGQDAQSRGTR